MAEDSWLDHPGEDKTEGSCHGGLWFPQKRGRGVSTDLCFLVTVIGSEGTARSCITGGSCWVLGKGSSRYGVQALERAPLWAKYNFFFTFKIIIEHVQGSTSAFLPSFQIVFSVLALLHLRWILKCNFKQDNISNSLITFLLTLFMIDFWYEEEYLSQARWTMT